jgi:hypothetical protein
MRANKRTDKRIRSEAFSAKHCRLSLEKSMGVGYGVGEFDSDSKRLAAHKKQERRGLPRNRPAHTKRVVVRRSRKAVR